MKKILFSVGIIGIASVAAVAGTIAYFSDVELSPGNTLTAGTIDLAVNGQNPLDSMVVTMYDIKPSKELPDTLVNLRNVGGNDGIADLHILLGRSSENMESESECEAENKVWNGELELCQGQETLNENICEVIAYDYCYDSNNNRECDGEDPQGYLEPSQNIDLGLLPAENLRRLWLSFHMSGEAGNEYQGDTCTFDIEFSLKQLGMEEN